MVYGYITAPKAGKVVPSEITLRLGTNTLPIVNCTVAYARPYNYYFMLGTID
jgi:hypothetical protein